MSFLHTFHKIIDPFPRKTFLGQQDIAGDVLDKPSNPPPPPGVPNPNDAQNAAQSTTDQMRQRRGLLANIYGGASAQAPVTGKTTLGT